MIRASWLHIRPLDPAHASPPHFMETKWRQFAKEIVVKATVEQAWDAMRDIGPLHTRLVPSFVVDTRLEPGARVTFANGRVVRERIVTINDEAHRLVWSATGDRLEHHNASAEVVAGLDGRTRVVWVADLLPESMAEAVNQLMDHGMAAMQVALDTPA